METYLYHILSYVYVEPYRTYHIKVNCFTFTGDFYLTGISDDGNVLYINFLTNETEENYNAFNVLTATEDERINLLYLTDNIFGKTSEEFIFIVEKVDENGEIKYHSYNSVITESITVKISELKYNSILNAFQLNTYLGLNIKYPMICYFDVYEMNWYGRLLKEQNNLEKLKTFLNLGSIAIQFKNQNLEFIDNKTIKFRLLPEEIIFPIRIFIGKSIIEQKKLMHLVVIFNSMCELDILKELNYPIYIVNDTFST